MGIIDRLKGQVGRQEGADQSGHGGSHGGSSGVSHGKSHDGARGASHGGSPGVSHGGSQSGSRASRWSYGTMGGGQPSRPGTGSWSHSGTQGGQSSSMGTGTQAGSRWTNRLTTKGGALSAGEAHTLAGALPTESAGDSFRYLYKKHGPIALLEQRTKEVLFEKFEHVELPPEELGLEGEKEYYGKLIDEAIAVVLAEGELKFPGVILKRLRAEILDGIIGYGPLQRLIEKEDVTEIMVNGPRQVFIEQKGKLKLTGVRFRDVEQLMQVVQKIVVPVGRRCDEFNPYTDARLPDGSRVNIVIQPVSLVGPVITIRRFSKKPYSIDRLVDMGTLTRSMADFVKASVLSHLNIIVSGGTGSGKTTTLNAISSYLPEGERIITIEDSAELQLQQQHVLSLETRQANVEGKGVVSIRDLLRNALRMIPKRIVIGECRGAEALDMVNALSMGNSGSLSTVHANSPKDMLGRLETMMMMAGKNMTSRLIRELIASAIHVIIQQARLSDGTRRITHISEVTGIVDGEIQTEDIYRWFQTGVDEDGKVQGNLKATGYIPRTLDKFFEENLSLPETLFEGGATVNALREGYLQRLKENARAEEARVKAKIALQMALEDAGVASDLSFDFGLTDAQATKNFVWRDALVERVDASREGKLWADARSSVADADKRPPDRLAKLQDRLKDLRARATGSGGETMSEREQKRVNRIFKSAILQEIPRILTFEGAQFRSRQEEEAVMRNLTETVLRNVSAELRWPLPPKQQQTIIAEALADMVGLGPIEKFIKDPKVSEVMVNGPRRIFVEVSGKLHLTTAVFEDDLHIMHVIRKIIAPLGRRCDESTPMVDARTNQGFRVNAIIPPLALNGPCLTIRKFTEKPFTMVKLIEMGSITREAADFIRACVQLGLNTFVSGGTGSGKTTTLNAISAYIPECRIVTIEDAAELRLQQKHVVRLETRPPNIEGRGAISIRDLLRNSLHMGPDRIIVGECRGGEALDMITAMSTGNRGSLSTGHANTPEDLIRRIETMILMAGVELPLRGIRDQVGSALDLVIHQDRFGDGTRRITHIAEVVGVVDGAVKVRDIFSFKHMGVDETTGKTIGHLEWTGVWPEFLLDFLDEAVPLPEGTFGPGIEIKKRMLEQAEKRRIDDEAAMRENLRRSRTYEEAVLLESDEEQEESAIVSALRGGTGTGAGPSRAGPAGFSYKAIETPEPAERTSSRELTVEERSVATARTLLEGHGLKEAIMHERMDVGARQARPEQERERLVERSTQLIDDVVTANRLFIKKAARLDLAIDLVNDIVGLGPIQRLIEDESITEVMINGPRKVFIERAGKLSLSDVVFRNDDHILRIMERILSPLGRRLDANSPLVDARTAHGYRVNGIIAPISAKGPIITIRKFTKKPMRMPDIVRIGSISQGMADFIAASVQLKLNVVISGGTGSGKTTTLNCVSAFVPEGERVVTIEDTAELRLQQPHVVSLETRQANQEGKGLISIRDLVRNSLHMNPDRIIVGECRGGEALDMLQSMNTGVAGSMTTIHASSPRDAMARLETMCLMARTALSSRSLREQISSAIDLIVQVNRFRDGTRKITHVTEIKGLKENRIELSDIFTYNRSGLSPEGKVLGTHKHTGYLPSFLLRFHKEEILLPEDVFGDGVPLSKVYERLLREHEVKDVRERNRRALRTRWGMLAVPGAGQPDGRAGQGDRAGAPSGAAAAHPGSPGDPGGSNGTLSESSGHSSGGALSGG